MSKKITKKLSIIITGLILFAAVGFFGNVSQVKATTPSITVIYPNGGENLREGTAYVIRWISQGVKEVSIEYSKKGEENISRVISAPEISSDNGEKTYYWEIPSYYIPTGEAIFGNDYKINIKEVVPSGGFAVSDSSDDYFSIIDRVTCTDTDGGRDYYTAGYATGIYSIHARDGYFIFSSDYPGGQKKISNEQFDTYYDYCRNDTQINEAFCDGNSLSAYGYQCPNGCKDGACIRGDEPYCSAIGSKSEGWYKTGSTSSSAYLGLIKWDNCDGCYAVCKAIGSKSEGWYSSCDGTLIKYDNCGEQKLPDLIVDSVSFNANYHLTSVKIKNIGEADYIYCESVIGNVCQGRSFDIDWKDLSDDKEGSTYNYRLVDIPAGKSEKFTLTKEIVSPGIHELEITVDSKNNIQESDENNNTKNLTISVSEVKLPDLIVEKAELRKNIDPHHGEQDVIAVTVKNTGSGYYIYTDSRMKRFINWSNALTGTEEGYMGNYRLIPIGPGESKEYIKQYIHSPDLKLLKVSVDPENKVKESNENNNSINIKVEKISSCLPDGTLIKLPNDPKIYVIINCQKRWIKTLDEFNQGNYKWENIQETNSEVVNAYADYLEAKANLLRSIGHNKVYRIINGKRLWIPTIAAFNAQGLKWNDIQNVRETEVSQYSQIKLAKLANKPEVYYLNENGFKRHIPTANAFNSYNHKWEDIVEVSSSELNSYPDSVLIRAKHKIYKLENGKKKWIKTAGAFNRMGYDWNQVSLVNKTEIDSYANGANVE